MVKPKHILLASHGTEGAQAAEKLALSFCGSGATLHHLIVVPDFWKGMQGDDWLNNASTRATFGRYVESQLEQEVREHLQRVRREAKKRRIRYRYEMVQGKPADCLIRRAVKGRVDLIVLGSPRPKGKSGLRSRMLEEKIFKSLPAPVLIAPHPHA